MTADWEQISARVIKLSCELQQIASPTFHEIERADAVYTHFSDLGLADIRRDAVGNVYGRLAGGGNPNPLVISAHMDSVFPIHFPLTLEQSGSRISGPGIGDNALGLGAMLMLPEMLKAEGITPAGNIWLVGTTGEEGLGNLRGILAATDRFGSTALGYISIEGMGLGRILHRGLGVNRFRISATTGGGHSWVDFGKPSAIHELTGLAAKLAGQRVPNKPRSTFNIGVIHGGTSVNTIAANAWMDVDLRSESAQGLALLTQRLERAVEGAQRKGVRFEIEKTGSRAAGELPREHRLVQVAARALSAEGILPTFDIASTEANGPLSRGYPALTLGVTSGDGAHTANEYIDLPPIPKGLRQLVQVVDKAWIIDA